VVTLQREAKWDQAMAAAKSCCFSSGVPVSCDRAGQLIDLRNFTKPRGSDGAKALYEKACNADVARGCLNLGHVEKEADHVEAARALYKKACALGLPDGCIEELQL
jgi:TPR repeat protein